MRVRGRAVNGAVLSLFILYSGQYSQYSVLRTEYRMPSMYICTPDDDAAATCAFTSVPDLKALPVMMITFGLSRSTE